MIEDGRTVFLWVCSDAVPRVIIDVFNLPSYEVLREGKVIAPPGNVVPRWMQMKNRMSILNGKPANDRYPA